MSGLYYPRRGEIALVNKAHREGRKAYIDGVSQRSNPYDGRAAKDSDEWLKHQNWHNGWNFASMFPPNKSKTKRSKK